CSRPGRAARPGVPSVGSWSGPRAAEARRVQPGGTPNSGSQRFERGRTIEWTARGVKRAFTFRETRSTLSIARSRRRTYNRPQYVPLARLTEPPEDRLPCLRIVT